MWKTDKDLIELVKNSYKSLSVIGRGTISIDPKEVYESEEHLEALQKASNLLSKKYCIFKCKLDKNTKRCKGCGRTLEEIKELGRNI